MYKSLQSNKDIMNSISLTYDYQKDDSEEHCHDFDEIVVVLEGSAIHRINGKRYIISAGDIFFIKSYDMHYFSDINKLYVFNIGFKGDFFEKYKELTKNIAGFKSFFIPDKSMDSIKSKIHLNTKELSEITEILKSLSKEYETKKSGCELMVTSYFFQLIIFICRIYEKKFHNQFLIYKSYEGAVSYIENNYAERITLKDLCKIAGVTPNALINFFRKNFGMTPVEYINSIRLNKACELLRKKHYNITYIATETGFLDTSYFSRSFKKYLGLTPSSYRKKYLNVN